MGANLARYLVNNFLNPVPIGEEAKAVSGLLPRPRRRYLGVQGQVAQADLDLRERNQDPGVGHAHGHRDVTDGRG